jgi:hypothetical protein
MLVVLQKIADNYEMLSRHKYASNAVERCLEKVESQHFIDLYLSSIMSDKQVLESK